MIRNGKHLGGRHELLNRNRITGVDSANAAYRNAQAILNDEWAAQAAENPLFQAPMTVADLKFARDLQLAGVSQMGPDFTNYAAVQQWIAANRPH